MMIRHDEKYTKIDDVEISEKIDDVFHKYITGKTGVEIKRINIHPFVVTLIQEHNLEELMKEANWDVDKDLDELGKEHENNSLKNKFLRLWK